MYNILDILEVLIYSILINHIFSSYLPQHRLLVYIVHDQHVPLIHQVFSVYWYLFQDLLNKLSDFPFNSSSTITRIVLDILIFLHIESLFTKQIAVRSGTSQCQHQHIILYSVDK